MARVNRIEYKCPDGVTRTFDSKSEVEFIEYCEKAGIKILEYNTDKHHKFELFKKPPDSIKSKKLEKALYKSGFLYNIERMRNMVGSKKSFDFHIEIEGVEFLCEIKGGFSNKNEMTMGERSFYTTWAMVKSMMASIYKKPIIVFVSKDTKYGKQWEAEYYIPEEYKDTFT